MRRLLDEQLALINKLMIEMSSSCEKSLELINDCLTNFNESSLKWVVENQQNVEHYQQEIQSVCLRLLLQQQPVASDLREVSAALKMIYDLNRIAIITLDMADILAYVAKSPKQISEQLLKMATDTKMMLSNSIDSYIKKDLKKAKDNIDYDDVIDDLFVQIRKSVINDIRESPDDGEFAIDILMIAKYYEKIADHAVNLASWVVFSIEGE